MVNFIKAFNQEIILYLTGDTKDLLGMNEKDELCDMGENWIDWDGSESVHMCSEAEKEEYKRVRDQLMDRAYFHKTYDLDCKNFRARHYCACEAIGPHNNPSYHSYIPTCHDHRPIWPKFGEYKFV